MKVHLLKKVLVTISKYRMVSPGDRILMAVSGGPDSMALLNIFHSLRERLRINLLVAHLNHMLRGDESERDAHFVESRAVELGLPVIIEKRPVRELQRKEKLSLEEAGRRIRYQFLCETAGKEGCQKIALAHTSDDQAETVLMKLLRGAGSKGLSGIHPVRGPFVRPLIDIERKEIEEFLHQEKIAFCLDSTNLDTRYMRNRLRLELFPLMKQRFNPQLIKHLKQLSDLIREDDYYLDSVAAEKLYEISQIKDNCIRIFLSKFNMMDPSIRSRLLIQALQHLNYEGKEITFTHIRQVMSLAEIPDLVKISFLPSRIVIQKNRQELLLTKRITIKLPREERTEEIELKIPGKTIHPASGVVIHGHIQEATDHINLEFGKESSMAYLDYLQVHEPLVIRTMKPGDRFQPLGMQGTKKLHDFFIDEKISREDRKKIPLLIDKKGIIWVIGKRISERCKITSTTLKVLILKVI